MKHLDTYHNEIQDQITDVKNIMNIINDDMSVDLKTFRNFGNNSMKGEYEVVINRTTEQSMDHRSDLFGKSRRKEVDSFRENLNLIGICEEIKKRLDNEDIDNSMRVIGSNGMVRDSRNVSCDIEDYDPLAFDIVLCVSVKINLWRNIKKYESFR